MNKKTRLEKLRKKVMAQDERARKFEAKKKERERAQAEIDRRKNARQMVRKDLVDLAPGANMYAKVRALRTALRKAEQMRGAEAQAQAEVLLNEQSPLRARLKQAEAKFTYWLYDRKKLLDNEQSILQGMLDEETDPEARDALLRLSSEKSTKWLRTMQAAQREYDVLYDQWHQSSEAANEILKVTKIVGPIIAAKERELNRIPLGAKPIHSRDGTLKYRMPGESMVREAADIGPDYPTIEATAAGQTTTGLLGKNTYESYWFKSLSDQRDEASKIMLRFARKTDKKIRLTPEEEEQDKQATAEWNRLDHQIRQNNSAKRPGERSGWKWKLVSSPQEEPESTDIPITRKVVREIRLENKRKASAEEKAAQDIAKENERRRKLEERNAAKRAAKQRQ